MNNKSLKRIYKHSIFYPSLVVLTIAVVYSGLKSMIYTGPQSEYISEWYELVVYNTIMALAYCVAVGILSLTVFLNRFYAVSSRSVLTRLAWFLLPFGFIAVTIGKAINELIDVGSYWEITYALLAGVPFMVGLTNGFRKFKTERG